MLANPAPNPVVPVANDNDGNDGAAINQGMYAEFCICFVHYTQTCLTSLAI